MPKVMLPFSIQLVADDADVFATDVNAVVPTWFRPKWLRLQLVYSDTDCLHSLRVGNVQLSTSSGPHLAGADNIQGPDWQKPHYLVPVPPQGDYDIVLDFNAVTAGVGLAMGQWEA